MTYSRRYALTGGGRIYEPSGVFATNGVNVNRLEERLSKEYFRHFLDLGDRRFKNNYSPRQR
jgi:hypothetical protein